MSTVKSVVRESNKQRNDRQQRKYEAQFGSATKERAERAERVRVDCLMQVGCSVSLKP